MILVKKPTKNSSLKSFASTLLFSTSVLTMLAGCSYITDDTRTNAQLLSSQGSILPYTVIDSSLEDGIDPTKHIEIRNGGFGSDSAAHPTHPSQFYALTDRGPNAKYKGGLGKGKLFPTPDYTPRIGLFELQADGSIQKIKEILLKDPEGNYISGLPNTANLGGTGETPYNKNGKPILVNPSKPFDELKNPTKTDTFGLDGEGLAALKDGTFWVSDEYGPHLVHFDANGREINRINPFLADKRNNVVINGNKVLLPAEFANRRANRGMEGLTITPDQTTLVGIMQSTMDHPSKAVRDQDITRIVTVNLVNGKVSQYLYQQEKPQNSNSGIVAIDNETFLVIERDGGFQLKTPGVQKHIYKVSLKGATNLESIKETTTIKQDEKLGLTINGQTLEQIVANEGSWKVLSKAGIKPVSKRLVLDAVKAFNYPHDKLEGMWLMGDGRLGLVNDDDFATWSTQGMLEQKYLDPEYSIEDASRLYIADGVKY